MIHFWFLVKQKLHDSSPSWNIFSTFAAMPPQLLLACLSMTIFFFDRLLLLKLLLSHFLAQSEKLIQFANSFHCTFILHISCYAPFNVIFHFLLVVCNDDKLNLSSLTPHRIENWGQRERMSTGEYYIIVLTSSAEEHNMGPVSHWGAKLALAGVLLQLIQPRLLGYYFQKPP